MRYAQIIEDSNFTPLEKFTEEVFSQPYFKHNTIDEVLYRNFNTSVKIKINKIIDGAFLIDTPKHREPVDSMPFIQAIVGYYSEEKYGINIRENNVFYGYNHEAEKLFQYEGNIFIAIPKGPYDLYYADEVDDFTYNFNYDYLRIKNVPSPFTSTNSYRDMFTKSVKYNFSDMDRKSLTHFFGDFVGRVRTVLGIFISSAATQVLSSEKISNLEEFNNKVSLIALEDIKPKLESFYQIKYKEYITNDIEKELPNNFKKFLFKFISEDLKFTIPKVLKEEEENIKDYVRSIKTTLSSETIHDEEIICHCESYYLINPSLYDKLKKEYYLRKL